MKEASLKKNKKNKNKKEASLKKTNTVLIPLIWGT